MLSTAMTNLLSSFFSATLYLLSFFCAALSLTSPPKDLSGMVKPARGQWCDPCRHSSRGSSRYTSQPTTTRSCSTWEDWYNTNWYNTNDLTFFWFVNSTLQLVAFIKLMTTLQNAKKNTSNALPLQTTQSYIKKYRLYE